jgi:inhibitor of KinA
LLVELGEVVSPEVHDRVVALDAALTALPPHGLLELVPSYGALLVQFDPLETTFEDVENSVRARLDGQHRPTRVAAEHVIPVCYDRALAPDLEAVAVETGSSCAEVATLHASGVYRVYMYGFAPGYAYLGGVPAALRLPRKTAAVRGVPSGSVIIAGAQCLVTTLEMPTGWWRIGRSPTRLFDPDAARPFPLRPGDRVRFEPMGRAAYDAEMAGLA